MKNNNKKTVWILTGVIILNLVLVGMYAYAFDMLKNKSGKASIVSGELNEYLSKEGTINLLKTSVKNTKDEREKVDTYFVSRDDIPKFTKEIESLGGMSGTELVITGLSTQGNILSFDLSSEGGFRNTLQLVSLIESLPFKVEVTKAYIDVVEIKIPKEEGGGTKTTWKGNFSVELTGFVSK
jgi:hypothetical protein